MPVFENQKKFAKLFKVVSVFTQENTRMKISKAKLKTIILEELQNVMGEMYDEDDRRGPNLYIKYVGAARDLVATKYPGHLEKYEDDEEKIYVGDSPQLKWDFVDAKVDHTFDGVDTYVIDDIKQDNLEQLMNIY